MKRTPFRYKPKHDVKITKDGRTIYQGKFYTAYRRFVWDLQEGKCSECGRSMFLFQMDLHHPGNGILGGRGMGGQNRDDSKAVGLCNIPREGHPRGCHSHMVSCKPEDLHPA
jgi:hypothetical protein